MKFTSLRATWRYWVTGIIVSAIGVLVARLVAPHYTEKSRAAVSAAGRLLGAGGLIIITIGMSRRIAAEDKETE